MRASYKALEALADVSAIGLTAASSLKLEAATYPKPGLVSHIDTGAHEDMDCAMLVRSADALAPYFIELAAAGAAGAGMDRLRAIGVAAEQAMLAATGGVNTHRGAIFGMGLLCAAAGFRSAYGAARSLGVIVKARWSRDILAGPVALHSHGAQVARRHGAGGARVQAATGFPALYDQALPALEAGGRLAPNDPQAARVHACMALIAVVEDTNLLHRGGPEGLAFAQLSARAFLNAGGVGAADWLEQAQAIHRAFVDRRLSPGGCADLLAMALFTRALEA